MIMDNNVNEETVLPVQIVTIKKKIPLFKKTEQANSIELIEVEENGFVLVAQKDLYQVGDKAIYIQPDYSLSDIPLFETFIRPLGDPKKSKLGSNYRIRAVKFNLHIGDDEPVFSVGILLPLSEVMGYLWSLPEYSGYEGYALPITNADVLGITKWIEPDHSNQIGLKTSSGRLYPEGVYKTDETNIKNRWGHLENKIGYPVHLVGSHKVDGSSITIIVKNEKDISVGSRTYIKSEMIEKIVGTRKQTLWDRIKAFFGYSSDILIKELIPNDDEFIVLAKPYIEKIKELFKNGQLNNPFILRGEANGQKWKGSGNKNNPNSKNEPNIIFYGVDTYKGGIAAKGSESLFNIYMETLGFSRCEVLINKVFNSKEEIEKECKEIFKTHKIEGIVFRTLDSKFSCKFMNDEYDQNK